MFFHQIAPSGLIRGTPERFELFSNFRRDIQIKKQLPSGVIGISIKKTMEFISDIFAKIYFKN